MTGMSGLPSSLASCTSACWLERDDFALVGLKREASLVVIGHGDGLGFHQGGVAIERGLVELDLGLLGGDVAQHPPVILLHRFDRQRHLREVGVGVLQRDLELAGIEPV